MTIRILYFVKSLFAVLALLMALPLVGNAQPVFTFSRIINNWPTIELYFTARCDSTESIANDASHFTVYQDAERITDFTFWCPSYPMHLPISVVVALDERADTNGHPLSDAKVIANRVVDAMYDSTDEAALVTFGDSVALAEPMTMDLDKIRQSAASVIASGPSNLWDGIYAALSVRDTMSNNSRGGVLIISNGYDNGSTHTLEEVALLAKNIRTQIFVFPPGPDHDPTLDTLCALTSGRLYTFPTVDDVEDIVLEMATMFLHPVECLITYQASCPDGQTHRVNLALNDFCSGSDMKTQTYRAPLDSTAIGKLFVSVDTVVSNYGQEVRIPVRYRSADSVVLPPSEFKLGNGVPLLPAAHIDIAGGAFEFAAVSISKTDSVFTVRTFRSLPLSGEGVLFNIIGSIKDHGPETSIALPITEWYQDSAACLAIFPEEGSLTIGTVGIGANQPILARTFSISPNPTSGAFHVALEFERPTAFSMRMVNVLGQTVYNRTVNEKRLSYRATIQITEAVPGVYFFMLESGGVYESRTVVVR